MALAGVVTTLFGVVALFWPGLTLATFVLLFSAYVLIAGVVALVRGFRDMSNKKSLWWLSILLGVLAIGVGVYLVRHPGVSFATLILIMGFAFIIQGAVDLVRGLFDDFPVSTVRAMSIMAGIIGVIAGIFVFSQPEAAGIAFVWVIGLYSLIVGPLMIASSFDIRKIEEKVEKA